MKIDTTYFDCSVAASRQKAAALNFPKNCGCPPITVTLSRTFRAFTLIELIIAIAISAIVMACLGTMFFGALRLRDKASLAAAQALPVDQAVSIMKRDLLGAVPVGKLAGPLGTDAINSGLPLTPLLEAFTTGGIVDDSEPWADVERIDYFLQPPTNRTGFAGQNLMRGVTRNLLSSSVVMPETRTLLQGVQTLQFSFYDGTNWQELWTTAGSNLPIAIKVSIDFAADKKLPQVQPPVQFYVPVVSWSSTNSITNQIAGN